MRVKSDDTDIRTYLNLISQRSKRVLDERLLPHNITPQQARLVGFVYGEIQEGKVVYQKDIEEAFQLKGSSITSLLQGLERRGFITRQVDADDERRKSVTLLPKGQQLVSEFEETFREIEEKMVRGLSNEQQALLRQMLEHMAHNLV